MGLISVFEPPLSETPSRKPQAPEKFQISSPKLQKTDAVANGVQVDFGAWSLELGGFAWALCFSKIGMRPFRCRLSGFARLTSRTEYLISQISLLKRKSSALLAP